MATPLLKRVFVGRALASHKLEHQLLAKTLALPVFSSDPLSSNAYATEEMMLVLVLAGTAAFRFMVPIALLIVLVLSIVITSYRQTVRAYPSGGGSYIVAHENLGDVPGVIAASALLSDYVLTVAVSITAGTLAITSAAPSLLPYKVPLSLGFIAVVALANLRGVKEAGILFAFPTYGFVITVYILLGTGLVRCLDACPQAESADLPIRPEHALTFFLLLRAFASGSTALTGVEAISNGVQAFKRPQAKNAATTLAMMGAMTIGMFIGITVLARAVELRVTEELAAEKSVLAQIGETVFGPDDPMFYVLQAFTALILILAANTAYQDFPRLSAILATDHYMPRQFMNRGDRLVFSNGIIVLSILAGLLVWIFDANLTRLIQLYLVGVFVAFTLSQAGMVRRWLRLREKGWRRSAMINGLGAVATGVVLVIITATKFIHGAWIVVAAVPLIVLLLLSIHRHYERVRVRLRRRGLTADLAAENTFVVVVPDFRPATREMISWLLTVRPEPGRIIPLYVGPDELEVARFEWARLAPRLGELRRLEVENGQEVRSLRRFVRGIERGPDDFVTVVVPEEVSTGLFLYILRRTRSFRVKAAFLLEPGVVVTDVPLLPEERAVAAARAAEERPFELPRNVCLVPVSGVHDATVRALAYARSLRPAHLEAVFLAGEPEEADEIFADWRERDIDIPLSAVEAPFRDYGPPLLEEIRRHTSRGDTIVTVVLPEFVVDRWRHALLHNQRALFF
ncbi:MAG TPA: APC family permease, partial [Actinomycetota bacterium]|nr:APC family permease [Actinomycetota bacterium]